MIFLKRVQERRMTIKLRKEKTQKRRKRKGSMIYVVVFGNVFPKAVIYLCETDLNL